MAGGGLDDERMTELIEDSWWDMRGLKEMGVVGSYSYSVGEAAVEEVKSEIGKGNDVAGLWVATKETINLV